jgi:hypothetical protein
MQRFFTCPQPARPSATKIDQHRPEHRPNLAHIAHILTLMGRPDPNSYEQCEIARDLPITDPAGARYWLLTFLVGRFFQRSYISIYTYVRGQAILCQLDPLVHLRFIQNLILAMFEFLKMLKIWQNAKMKF